MCGRLLGIRAQAMQKIGKEIKTFLDGFWDEHDSRHKWWLESKKTGLGGGRNVE